MNVTSSIGDQSTSTSECGCYIAVPALIEVDSSQKTDPYVNESTPIAGMDSNEHRRRAFSNGEFYEYWTRSPSVVSWTSTKYYVNSVESTGAIKNTATPSTSLGVLIQMSF